MSLLVSSGIYVEDEADVFCFGSLPKDLVEVIFYFLDLKSALSAFCVCRAFRRLSLRASVWEKIYENTFGICRLRREFVALFKSEMVEDDTALYEHKVEDDEHKSDADDVTFSSVPTNAPGPGVILPYRWLARAHTVPVERGEAVLHSGLGVENGPNDSYSYLGLWQDKQLVLGFCVVGERFVYGGEILDKRGHGLGVTVFPSGAFYIGEFTKGELDGEGKLYYKEGDYYEGEWKKNEKQGFGIYRWASGNVYTGQWNQNRREGCIGQLVWVNGDVYIGNWLDNKRLGVGLLRWSVSRGGGYYIGEFNDNQLNGFGRFRFRNIKFEGSWLNDRREGKGVLKWEDGDYYEGMWKNGGRNGKSFLHLKNGKVLEQEWNEPADIKYSQQTPKKFLPDDHMKLQ